MIVNSENILMCFSTGTPKPLIFHLGQGVPIFKLIKVVLVVWIDDLQFHILFNIGIKHGFPCINVCQVPREMLKTEAVGRGFQHLPRDLPNVNVLENNV